MDNTYNIHTDKKENKIILIDKEIQNGSSAKSYMRKGLLIYEEVHKYFAIYDEAVSHIWLCTRSFLKFLIYEENLIFFFISAIYSKHNSATSDTFYSSKYYDNRVNVV